MRDSIQNIYIKTRDGIMEKLYRLEQITGMHRAILFTYLFVFITLLSITVTIMLLLPYGREQEVTIIKDDINYASSIITEISQDFEFTEPIVIPKYNDEQVSAVYAGRYDDSKSKYNMLGLPKDRGWLTSKEWSGNHMLDVTLRSRFKMWKALHIKEFIEYMKHLAKEEVKTYPDIPEELIVAQAIIESNFGLSRIAVESNNLFGHKCHGCKDNYIIAHDDSPTDKFQIKKTKWNSVRSHSKLLMGLYRSRIKGKPTLEKWYKALCGCTTVKGSKRFREKETSKGKKGDARVYATSCFKGPGYINKLKKIIKAYKL